MALASYVRFGSKADIVQRTSRCPLSAKSGHRLCNSVCPLSAKSGRLRRSLLTYCRGLVAELKVADCRNSRANWKAPRRHVGDVMQMTIATVLAGTFSISVSAQEFLAGSGTPRAAFPNPDRPVADIVSPIWHGEKERDAAGKAQQLVRLLQHQIRDDRRGYWRRQRLLRRHRSPRCGVNHGRIVAEDVITKIFAGLRRRVRDLGLRNVVISLGEPHDPQELPNQFAQLCNSGAHVQQDHPTLRPALQYSVAALKPEARVGVVDAYGPTSKHGTPPDLLRCELAAVGYRQISIDELKGSDAYLAIFAPPSVASRTRPEAMVACKAP